MKYEFLTLVLINPKQLAKFRDALGPSGSKDDPTDAELIAELCAKHGDRLRVGKPDTEETRPLALLCEDRRSLVNQRTALTNRLKSQLKQYLAIGEFRARSAARYLASSYGVRVIQQRCKYLETGDT